MTILALEFSSDQRSVALARAGNVLGETVETAGRGTAAFAMVENVLAQAKMEREEIPAIAVGLGPGSYTGVRASIAIARGWQLARGIKTIGVSSAAAIAARAQAEKIWSRLNVIIYAQREEFYLAEYEISETACAEMTPLTIVSLAEVQSRSRQGETLVGPEAAKFGGRAIFPRASDIAKLAAGQPHFPSGAKLEPIYLRETNFVKARP